MIIWTSGFRLSVSIVWAEIKWIFSLSTFSCFPSYTKKNLLFKNTYFFFTKIQQHLLPADNLLSNVPQCLMLNATAHLWQLFEDFGAFHFELSLPRSILHNIDLKIKQGSTIETTTLKGFIKRFTSNDYWNQLDAKSKWVQVLPWYSKRRLWTKTRNLQLR